MVPFSMILNDHKLHFKILMADTAAWPVWGSSTSCNFLPVPWQRHRLTNVTVLPWDYWNVQHKQCLPIKQQMKFILRSHTVMPFLLVLVTCVIPVHCCPELIWATSRLMSPDRGFGTSCLLHCGHLTVSANSEDSWKRFCLSRTRLWCLVTLAFRHRI